MTACKKQGWRKVLFYFTTSVSRWVEFLWIVNRLKSKNPLCKTGMAEPVSLTATLGVSTKQDLNWVVIEISEHWALPRLTQARKLRVQKSPSTINRVWELQSSAYKPKKAFASCLAFQCGLVPPHESHFHLQAQLWAQVGQCTWLATTKQPLPHLTSGPVLILCEIPPKIAALHTSGTGG